jgi:hypothetical protein
MEIVFICSKTTLKDFKNKPMIFFSTSKVSKLKQNKKLTSNFDCLTISMLPRTVFSSNHEYTAHLVLSNTQLINHLSLGGGLWSK